VNEEICDAPDGGGIGERRATELVDDHGSLNGHERVR
jgi:hypothetical protein